MSGFSSRAGKAIALLMLVCAVRASADGPVAPLPPCPQEGDVVSVIASKRELWLCQQGAALALFRVSLGRGGVDKRREGDGRTPLGTYTLGSPRQSAQFGLFIPIEYPTPEQAAQGFTGAHVGIHGPPRGASWDEYPLTAVDWTQGCIATAKDSDIGFIADFVLAYHPILVIR